MKKLISLLIVLAVVAVLVYAGSPYYQAYQLKQAYDRQDGAAIAAAIDYEQLRPNLKTQLQQKFSHTLSQYPLVAQLGGSALTVAADELIDRSVDGAVTPDNIATAIRTGGQVNDASKELAAAWAIASNQVNLTDLIQQLILHRGDVDAVVKAQIEQMVQKQAQQNAMTTSDDKPTLNYCGSDCFRISGQIKGYPVTLEMQRQGLIDWKVVNVVLS